MPKRIDIPLEEIVQAYNNIEAYPRIADAARSVGLSQAAFDRRVRQARAEGYPVQVRTSGPKRMLPRPEAIAAAATEAQEQNAPTIDDHLQQRRYIIEIQALQEKIKGLEERAMAAEAVRELVGGCADVALDFTPEWATSAESLGTSGFPVLFLSDIHGDEVIDPKQIEGLNAYNREIMDRRLEHTFDKSAHIFQALPNPNYNGAYILLGGDMLPGYIHDELRQTSEEPLMVSLLHMVEKLGQGISHYADRFSNVMVIGVVGNHGRVDRKPRHKYRVQDNFDWLLYHMLAGRFAGDERVQFKIPNSTDHVEEISGVRYLLTHGDQFRGGSGISGFFTPLTLGASRKQRRHATMGKSYQVLITGHFHQKIITDHMLVNGSVSGYSEFAYHMNMPYERPQQLTWIWHPEHGIVHPNPILCDAYEGGGAVL